MLPLQFAPAPAMTLAEIEHQAVVPLPLCIVQAMVANMGSPTFTGKDTRCWYGYIDFMGPMPVALHVNDQGESILTYRFQDRVMINLALSNLVDADNMIIATLH